jgi:hypothetical protein
MAGAWVHDVRGLIYLLWGTKTTVDHIYSWVLLIISHSRIWMRLYLTIHMSTVRSYSCTFHNFGLMHCLMGIYLFSCCRLSRKLLFGVLAVTRAMRCIGKLHWNKGIICAILNSVSVLLNVLVLVHVMLLGFNRNLSVFRRGDCKPWSLYFRGCMLLHSWLRVGTYLYLEKLASQVLTFSSLDYSFIRLVNWILSLSYSLELPWMPRLLVAIDAIRFIN